YSLQWKSDGYGADSYPNYRDLRDRNRSFTSLAAYSIDETALATPAGTPSSVWLYAVSGNYFQTLGVRAYFGRLLRPADDHGPNSAPLVVLSYGFWRSRFAGNRAVVGRTVELNQHPFTIIGVTPPGFRGTLAFYSPTMFVPLVNQQQIDGNDAYSVRSGRTGVFEMLGHLRPGVTPARATADVNAIAAALAQSYPKADAHLVYSLGRPALAGDFLGSPVRAFLAALMMLAALILLAACANLASLFAARAADRGRDIAVRLALGARRAAVLRQLLSEAVVVALAGGALGLCGAVAILRQLTAWKPFPQYAIHLAIAPDGYVYAFAAVLALASGLLFGALGIRHVLRTNPYAVIKAAAVAHDAGRSRLRSALLAVQIALCALLVTSALVAVRGLVRSLNADLGFNPQGALLVDTDLGLSGYKGKAIAPMQKRMLAAMRALPGVSAVGLIGSQPPLLMGSWDVRNIYRSRTSDLRSQNAAAEAVFYAISPGYLDAAGTPLLAGRRFRASDDAAAPPVALINRYFAQKVFGGSAEALGQYCKLSSGKRLEVVGIVPNGKYIPNFSVPLQPALFIPLKQSQATNAWLVLRSHRDPAQLAAAVRAQMKTLDPGLPVFAETWEQEMNGAYFGPRVASATLGVLGLIGALLSLVGVFGMAAYAVSKRRHELGIRMALGARHKEVLGSALGPALRLLVWGSAAGLLLGVVASQVLSAIVYEATPRDPVVLGGAVAAMALLGLLATWIPARRALAIDPARLLRED
ncbi:MAG: ADOP family duplicated permease, partial [Terriglobales bacterium]